MKDLGVNLAKHVQGLCAENYTTLMKEIKGVNKGGDLSCSYIGKLNIIQISIPTLTNALMQPLSGSQQDFFVDTDKIILKYIWRGRENRIIKKFYKSRRS